MAKALSADLSQLQQPSSDPTMTGQDPVIEQVTVGTAALHPVLRALDDGMSPYIFVISKSGNVGVFSSPGFSDLFLSSEEACQELREHKILPDYLWANLVAPSSLSELYESITSLQFGISGEMGEISLVVTLRDRRGCEYPGLFRLRHVVSLEKEYSSTMVSIIPLPPHSLHHHHSSGSGVVVPASSPDSPTTTTASSPSLDSPHHHHYDDGMYNNAASIGWAITTTTTTTTHYNNTIGQEFRMIYEEPPALVLPSPLYTQLQPQDYYPVPCL